MMIRDDSKCNTSTSLVKQTDLKLVFYISQDLVNPVYQKIAKSIGFLPAVVFHGKTQLRALSMIILYTFICPANTIAVITIQGFVTRLRSFEIKMCTVASISSIQN